MTTANKITIFRILLIPVFVWLMLDYIRDYQKGDTKEWERVLAYAIFATSRRLRRCGRLHRAPLPPEERTGHVPRSARRQGACWSPR